MTHQYFTQRELEERQRLFEIREQACANQAAYRILYPPDTQTPEQREKYLQLLKEWRAAADAYAREINLYFFA
jgi:hypothetical protein